jgi:hypothetical protein
MAFERVHGTDRTREGCLHTPGHNVYGDLTRDKPGFLNPGVLSPSAKQYRFHSAPSVSAADRCLLSQTQPHCFRRLCASIGGINLERWKFSSGFHRSISLSELLKDNPGFGAPELDQLDSTCAICHRGEDSRAVEFLVGDLDRSSDVNSLVHQFDLRSVHLEAVLAWLQLSVSG